MRPGLSTQRGIALMLVLWVLTLLTIMAVSLTMTQRTELMLTDNYVGNARFRAVSEAALAYAALNFLAPPVQDPERPVWQPDGQPRLWIFADTAVRIRVFNEASRINLNQAPLELLTALLKALGEPDASAETLASAIVDWRDEDDLTLPLGAEDADYRADGRFVGARDTPFVLVEELRQVLGMSPEIYERLASEVTVDSNSASADETFASPAVIAALQGIPLEDAEQWVMQRDAPELPGGVEALPVNRGGPLYRVEIVEEADNHLGRRMEALIEITAGAQPPWQIRWRRFGLAGTRATVPDAAQ